MHDEPRKSSFRVPLRCAESMTLHLDDEVVSDEVGPVRVVRQDAADVRRGEEYVIGLLGREEGLDRILPSQIQLLPRAKDETRKAVRLQTPDDGAPDEPAVAGDEDPGSRVHS